jgi:2,4'-dihydroxyacetophenone dioxygenase
MSITAFNSFTDGLDPNRRSREHFIANINVEDDRLWVPYAEGVWFQPCCFNVTSGGFSVILKGLPGAKLGIHYHVGTVHGYTMRGHWRYLEHDWVAKPGTFIYEPAGEASNTDFLICAVAERRSLPILTTDTDFTRLARILPITLYGREAG